MAGERLAMILADCWDLLCEGATEASSPLHTPVLGTVSNKEPRVRTVVLRRVDPTPRRLVCHTDRRSAKVLEIGTTPRIAWLFYDSDRKLQLRLLGDAIAQHEGRLADEQWQACGTGSRRCYLTEPGPGATLPRPGSTLPPRLRGRRPTREESEAGRSNFMIVRSVVDEIDWLSLSAQGHERAFFRWKNGEWHSEWVAP